MSACPLISHATRLTERDDRVAGLKSLLPRVRSMASHFISNSAVR